ncbi:MAG TPA: isochorismatase family protein [Candidatus Binataceae bacterium]|nr:isochorismatase family protein [Candidatus Binataceae bacterium]
MTRIWDTFLTERDKAVIDAAGFGARAGYGARPALVIVDVTYGFTGDRPELILDSIKRWSSSCGQESWDAIAVIKRVADVFRAKRLPVIYSRGEARSDNWDSGSWSWKNTRTAEAVERDERSPGFNKIVAEIAPQPRDIVIPKQKPSAFFGTSLLGYLVLLGCDSIVVTGTTTSGCVRATVIDAFSANFRSIVIEDGCFDRAQASHAISLFDMHAKYADVVASSEVLDYVAGLSDDLFPNLPSG